MPDLGEDLVRRAGRGAVPEEHVLGGDADGVVGGAEEGLVVRVAQVEHPDREAVLRGGGGRTGRRGGGRR